MSTDTLFKVEMGSYKTGNIEPLLHEIRHAIKRLLDTGEETTIDLRSLPLAPGESEKLEAILGTGEISAKLEALGESEIRETRFSGVWLTIHYNSNREVIGKFIEVAFVPAILRSQRDDVSDTLETLGNELEETDAIPNDFY